MKLWQGWHNTDLGRSYFHYGPLGGTKKQMGILAQTCKKKTWSKKQGEKVGNGKKPSGRFFLSYSRKIMSSFCFFSLSKKQFLNVMLKGVDGSS